MTYADPIPRPHADAILLPAFAAPPTASTPRGYGIPHEAVIVLGSHLDDQLRNFAQCTVAAHVWLPYGVRDEETDNHPEILVCHHLHLPWKEACATHKCSAKPKPRFSSQLIAV